MNDMTRAFKITEEFDKQWKHMGLADDDLRRLEREILDSPSAGAVISGTGRLRKMRFAFEGKGKSGSIRVLYVDFPAHGIVYLITAYPKNVKENITSEERHVFKQFIEQIEKSLGGKGV